MKIKIQCMKSYRKYDSIPKREVFIFNSAYYKKSEISNKQSNDKPWGSRKRTR